MKLINRLHASFLDHFIDKRHHGIWSRIASLTTQAWDMFAFSFDDKLLCRAKKIESDEILTKGN